MKTIFVIRPDDIAKYGPGIIALVAPLLGLVGILAIIGGICWGVWALIGMGVEWLQGFIAWIIATKIWVFSFLLIPGSIIYLGYKHEQRKKLTKELIKKRRRTLR